MPVGSTICTLPYSSGPPHSDRQILHRVESGDRSELSETIEASRYPEHFYPVSIDGHPQSLVVPDERLLPHLDAWLCGLFRPEREQVTPPRCCEART